MNISEINNSNYKIYQNNTFGSRNDVSRQMKIFIDDLLIYSQNNKLKLKSLENFARRYIPEVTIEKLSPKEIEKMSAVCTPEYTFVDNVYNYGGSVISLNPNIKSKAAKIKLLKNFVHEMTHAFQSKDKDISELNVYNSFLAANSPNDFKRLLALSKCIFDSERYTSVLESIAADITDLSSSEKSQLPHFSFVKFFEQKFSEDIQKLKDMNLLHLLEPLKKLLVDQAKDEAQAYHFEKNFFEMISNGEHDYFSEVWEKIHRNLAHSIEEYKK